MDIKKGNKNMLKNFRNIALIWACYELIAMLCYGGAKDLTPLIVHTCMMVAAICFSTIFAQAEVDKKEEENTVD